VCASAALWLASPTDHPRFSPAQPTELTVCLFVTNTAAQPVRAVTLHATPASGAMLQVLAVACDNLPPTPGAEPVATLPLPARPLACPLDRVADGAAERQSCGHINLCCSPHPLVQLGPSEGETQELEVDIRIGHWLSLSLAFMCLLFPDRGLQLLPPTPDSRRTDGLCASRSDSPMLIAPQGACTVAQLGPSELAIFTVSCAVAPQLGPNAPAMIGLPCSVRAEGPEPGVPARTHGFNVPTGIKDVLRSVRPRTLVLASPRSDHTHTIAPDAVTSLYALTEHKMINVCAQWAPQGGKGMEGGQRRPSVNRDSLRPVRDPSGPRGQPWTHLVRRKYLA